MRLCGCKPNPKTDRLYCDGHIIMMAILGALGGLILGFTIACHYALTR